MVSMKPGRGAAWPLFLAFLLIFSAVAAAQKGKNKPSEKDPQYQYEKGVLALKYGLTDEAIRYGNLAVSIDPNHYGGWSLLGNAYYRKGNYADAVGAYEKAAALKPGVAEVHAYLGMAYMENGDMDKAEAELTKAHAMGGNAIASYNLAKIHYGQKKFDQALEEIVKAIAQDPRSPAAYNLKGAILNDLRRYPEALGSFQAGLVLSPNDIPLQINLGVAYANTGDPAKARAAFEKVLPTIQDEGLKAKVEELLKSVKDR